MKEKTRSYLEGIVNVYSSLREKECVNELNLDQYVEQQDFGGSTFYYLEDSDTPGVLYECGRDRKGNPYVTGTIRVYECPEGEEPDYEDDYEELEVTEIQEMIDNYEYVANPEYSLANQLNPIDRELIDHLESKGYFVSLYISYGKICASLRGGTSLDMDDTFDIQPFTFYELCRYYNEFSVDEAVDCARSNVHYRAAYTVKQSLEEVQRFAHRLFDAIISFPLYKQGGYSVYWDSVNDCPKFNPNL
jgi:hypothetical protein